MTEMTKLTGMTDLDGMTDMSGLIAGEAGLQGEGSTDLAEQLQALREEVGQLRAEVVRLDGDLDESRRLNLRAAELLDILYEELGARKDGGAS
jgi:hypothetical protein